MTGKATGIALFDLDNTLIDRDRGFLEWAVCFARDRGLGNDDVDWLVLTDDDGHVSRPEFFSAVRTRFDLPDPVDALVDAYRVEAPTFYRPDPALLEALAALRRAGWRSAIVTNGPATQEDKIRAAGLHAVVDGWCCSGVVGAAKPDRTIFEAAADRCRSPLSGWMVGDNAENDIFGGRDAGLRTIWMARNRVWDTTDYEPDHVVERVVDAVDHILTADA